jgi:hypothetical protein
LAQVELAVRLKHQMLKDSTELLAGQHLLALTLLFMVVGVVVAVAVQLEVLALVVLVEAQAVLVKILPLMQLPTDQVDTRHLTVLRVLVVVEQLPSQAKPLVASGVVLRAGVLTAMLLAKMAVNQFMVVVAVVAVVVLTKATTIGLEVLAVDMDLLMVMQHKVVAVQRGQRLEQQVVQGLF